MLTGYADVHGLRGDQPASGRGQTDHRGSPPRAAVAYPGTETSTTVESGFRLSNEAITATITGCANPNISGVTAHGVANDFSLRNLFALRLADGTITPSNSIAGATTAVDIAADADSIRLAARHPGCRAHRPAASPEGQLRRACLYYTEREKAHARRLFLHYQSWFDLKPNTSQDPASNTLEIQTGAATAATSRWR